MSLPATMQALMLQRLGCVDLVEMPVPQPRPGEVLVRTTATTICTSDLQDIAGNLFGAPMPRILGHEGAGVVAAVGEGVEGVRLGQAVAAHPVIPCRNCANCARGLGHLCLQMAHLGLNRDGTFADYFRVPANRTLPTPAGIDPAVAALLEPVSVCLEAIQRGRVGENDAVLILGDGPFGILTARLAVRRRAKRVIVAGRHEFRLGRAPGAVTILQRSTEDTLRAVREHAGADGVDVAILCVSSAEAVGLALATLRARGRLVIFSAIPPAVPIDLFRLHTQELEILGACNDEDRHHAALGLLTDPELDLDSLVTHRLPLSQWKRALDLAAHAKDEALKVALVFGDSR
jgi:threonine dehydrogenase-like Zn-dependent dehydrogenase